MQNLFQKYTEKLVRGRTAVPESIRFYGLDDAVIASRRDEWLPVFTEVFKQLNITAMLFAKPSLPFADVLIERAGPQEDKLITKDSEAKMFLHDIPFIRESDWKGISSQALAQRIIACLSNRKAVILQNLGVVATGAAVEQAYIWFATVFHTTFVKYLCDLLVEGFKLPGEEERFEQFKTTWLKSPDLSDLLFSSNFGIGNAESLNRTEGDDAIYREICRVGRYTVKKGYVDSFFGNISYFDGKTIAISQTTSSLDELEGRIALVPLDNPTAAGLSASSEFPAHREIYVSSDYHAVLHGHPKFSVIMSIFCQEANCAIEDCNRLCDRKRSVCGIPIVTGEAGAGGLAQKVSPAIRETGVCIAYGHGVFAAGRKDLKEAFMKMAEAEDRCREEYFKLLAKKINHRGR